MTLARRYLLLSLAMIAIGSVLLAGLAGALIEANATNRTASLAALYVEGLIAPEVQGLATGTPLTAKKAAWINQRLAASTIGSSVMSFRIWSPDGQILYSPEARLVGQRFEVDEPLAKALGGGISAHISDLSETENVYETSRWSHLLEIYIPVRATGTDRVIAATEFYQLPDELEAEVFRARIGAWAIVAAAALAGYLVLARLVRSGSATIARQELALKDQVTMLSGLLERNSQLHGRLRRAAVRTTTLNEQERLRIRSDLHDGPVQVLALAMLRLDAIDRRLSDPVTSPDPDVSIVRGAVVDAIDEMRGIAADLRLPSLVDATPAALIRRVVVDHERRTGRPVRLDVIVHAAQVPLATKIALYRILQEALSNTERHAAGRDVAIVARQDGSHLTVAVSDAGPGFIADAPLAEDHLGLAGMRERAELLDGSFELESAPGQGTIVRVRLPIDEGQG